MGFIKKLKTSIDTSFGGDDPELMASPLIGAAVVENMQITGSSVQRGGAPPEQVCVSRSRSSSTRRIHTRRRPRSVSRNT